MSKTQKIITSILSLVLCVLFAVSILDTCEIRKQTNFDQDKIMVLICFFINKIKRSCQWRFIRGLQS